ncbi:MAG TPA: ribosome small subunit-dependent GTPase A [Burkholderiales bacterium]|nr:ribosome small subunit-dependent GTPase A [Burkholderiales bacterium]
MRYRVEVPGAGGFDCVSRAKRTDFACGDRVLIAPSAPGQAVIQAALPRTSLLYRSDAWREKLIAANVTQAIIVTAAVPPPHQPLIDRCLVAAEHAGIRVVLVLNKSDLPQHSAQCAALERYAGLGYPLLPLSAKRNIAPLRPALQSHLSVLVGASGVGKSTMVNALVPDAAARTAEISRALGSGRHTTTHARLYPLDAQSAIIDSPGLQAFGLHHIDREALAQAFAEFRPYLGACRFRDCRHRSEPGCAVEAAAQQGKITAWRLSLYREFARERAGARRTAR